MTYHTHAFDPQTNAAAVADFRRFPRTLYQPAYRTQNAAEEAQLLAGTHALSPTFALRPFLTRDATGRVCARGALTLVPNAQTAYLGFVEMIDDFPAWQSLLTAVKEAARAAGCTTLVGPVNASLWIGYRLKIDHFDRPPYPLELYQLPYYHDFFKRSGFRTTDTYESNFYPAPTTQRIDRLYPRVKARMTANGYVIHSLREMPWPTALAAVERLVGQLFADFPVYRPLTHPQFTALFDPLRLVLDPQFVQLVTKNDRVVGFLIALPDYGNWLTQPLSLARKLRILWRRRHAKRFVIAYMGVDPVASGIGVGMAQALQLALAKRGATSISALIHEGKATGRYFKPHIEQTNHYVLMALPL